MIRLLLSLLRDGLGLMAGCQKMAERAVHKAVAAALIVVVLTVPAIAALVFFYIFAYHRLTEALDADSAAAILCGANLLAIALVLIVRAIMRSQRRHAESASPALGQGDSDAAIALGLALARKLRDKAPEVALVAAIVGLALGARPELLNLFKPRAKPPSKDRS